MKRKLSLDELKVDSFATEAEAPTKRRGTVRGFDESRDTCFNSCGVILTCQASCPATCPFTCVNTCEVTCPGCW